ncbi:MAG: PRC-barrel domain-containing protein [Candidatus Poseidonia sp.]|jgi:sporulation protein YlmC with PRC-barrel domain|nr:PRC-barrel domain-containing protein [Poseidonia sp.]
MAMVQGIEVVSQWTGLDVYLPDGRKLGVVHDAVLDADNMQCTHVFVRDTPEALVEGSIPLAVPWRWIRAIDEIVLLRWFPPTPIPINS